MLQKAKRLLNKHGIINFYSHSAYSSRVLMHSRDVRKGESNRAAQVLTMNFTEHFIKETFFWMSVLENPRLLKNLTESLVQAKERPINSQTMKYFFLSPN